jgi:two-component system NtrC family sensor kinase
VDGDGGGGGAGGVELARAEAHHRRQVDEATAERLESLGRLAMGLAHEVNNPLSYVLANLNAVEDELPELREVLRAQGAERGWTAERVEELEECVRESREGAERVREVIRGMRAYAVGPKEPWQPVDVNEVVTSALQLTREVLEPRARVVVELGEVPRVEGSRGRLSQVVQQLLENAVQALEPGAPGRNEVMVRTWVEEAWLRLEVRDTGRGIAAEDLRHVFEPFFTRQQVGQGMGLGLWLCHNVVRAHGGHLEVESTPGMGSRFVVRLPLVPGEQPVQAPSPSPRTKGGAERADEARKE